MNPTQRIFENVETGESFRLYTSCDASKYHLISEGNKKRSDGTEVNGFYLAPFTGASIKLNNGKVVNIGTGQFYHLKENEKVTHRKFTGFKKFTKV